MMDLLWHLGFVMLTYDLGGLGISIFSLLERRGCEIRSVHLGPILADAEEDVDK